MMLYIYSTRGESFDSGFFRAFSEQGLQELPGKFTPNAEVRCV